jgi:putative DNA methylase
MPIDESLPLRPSRAAISVPEVTALEIGFPAAVISQLAEVESWRKEIHRPATHTHKWWAQRLGTVFRAILVSTTCNDTDDVIAAYAGATRMTGLRVLDPFAGSGTTLVEAVKAGASVVGVDINPVAGLVQRQALAGWDEAELRRGFKTVEGACRADIEELHRDVNGYPVLYYFWVAIAQCPTCHDRVELFNNYVFARHAYAKKFPSAKATCPVCHSVQDVDLSKDSSARCVDCNITFSFDGPVSGQTMTCLQGHRNRVIDALGQQKPNYGMYAKLVLRPDGKAYERIDDFDRSLYTKASKRLASPAGVKLVQPAGELAAGYNTVQAMRWGFKSWRDFFNDRQLYCLGLLATSIRDLDCNQPEREALAALFSGTLEFNNLFCSFKGEGTGAVRHMFSHHVLKPERTPLEAHPWGTLASSGSFSTLFESRLIRAHRYKKKPVDLVPGESSRPQRLTGISQPILCDLNAHDVATVITGNSAATGLESESIDLIVTDPPYMDNVHYSELADFFHAWLASVQPYPGYSTTATTRVAGEVQDTTADGFASSIKTVWRECARVLKPSGLLAFTFHQAKLEGWLAVMEALAGAGFVVSATQPVKAEMSVAAPKHGANEPSTLDTIVVCRKSGHAHVAFGPSAQEAAAWARARLLAIAEAGVNFGTADVRSAVRGSVLALITQPGRLQEAPDLRKDAEQLANEAVAWFLGGRSVTEPERLPDHTSLRRSKTTSTGCGLA